MHVKVALLAGACLLASNIGANANPIARTAPVRSSKATTWKPAAFTSASPDKVSSNVMTLTKIKSARGNKRCAAWNLFGGSTQLLALEIGEEFATEIDIAGQKFQVVVDTGSSDTWVVEKGFECVSVSNSSDVLAESACAFGPTYTSGSSFKQIPNEFFNISYGDGEFLNGVMGTNQITLAGIEVTQEMALVNFAGWNGDGVTSGLTGLAFPALTSAYSNSTKKQIPYNPIFTTMYEEGKVFPLFSLAILRDVSGPSGYLTLGGLPPIDFVPEFASTPILITNIQGYPTSFDFYTINIDGLEVNDKKLTAAGGSAIQYIIDSGTTLNFYPTEFANQVNAAFNPPAVYDSSQGAYVVDCHAKPPKHGVTINGKTFHINPLDMILDAGTDSNGKKLCISGITDGGSSSTQDLFILGDTFQKNVVTVFDVGAAEMRFAAREYYKSNDHY
ncbi:Acid protease [Penicillium ucsense]|uniref:penicillopepsin n=1 Tax=Penicillium ucsense TaxID=2839758 RepID=A0A8J8VX28_9EURO|nr:Acid protease [Penicillium ucsense]KAF7731025.1 Acid protease [Penicillium ucsense]